MAVDRRSLLKALALAPAMFTGGRTVAEGLLPSSGKALFKIHLFGLFIMEFQGDNLILVTPQYHNHEYCLLRYDSKEIQDLPEYIALWDKLTPGSIKEFPPKSFTFPADLITSKPYAMDPTTPHKHKHRCTMVLPKPCLITVNNFQDSGLFDPKPGRVGDWIKKENNAISQRGSRTTLTYESRDGSPGWYAYFSIHHHLNLCTVNSALRSVRHVCGDGFDLQLQSLPKLYAKMVHCPSPARLDDFVKQSDAGPLQEAGAGAGVDIASCPQFGIKPPRTP